MTPAARPAAEAAPRVSAPPSERTPQELKCTLCGLDACWTAKEPSPTK